MMREKYLIRTFAVLVDDAFVPFRLVPFSCTFSSGISKQCAQFGQLILLPGLTVLGSKYHSYDLESDRD